MSEDYNHNNQSKGMAPQVIASGLRVLEVSRTDAKGQRLRFPRASMLWETVRFNPKTGRAYENNGVLKIIAFWASAAEDILALRKGDTVTIVGEANHNRWTGDDGEERDYGIQVAVSKIVVERRGLLSQQVMAPEDVRPAVVKVTKADLVEAYEQLSGKTPPTAWNKAQLTTELKKLRATPRLS